MNQQESQLLTKEKGEHADDIVVLTPEFIKAIQGYDEIGFSPKDWLQ